MGVEMLHDRSQTYDFFSITKDLEPPGPLFQQKQYSWRFNSVDKANETYSGSNVRLRYFVRLQVLRAYAANTTCELDFAVQNLFPAGDQQHDQARGRHRGLPAHRVRVLEEQVPPQGCGHREGVLPARAHQDQAHGARHHPPRDLRVWQPADRRQPDRHEVRDHGWGARPRRVLPVRLYLAGNELTPTYKNVQNKFSVRYFLNLVLVDQEDRRYFKQQEIVLWRKKIG